MKVIFLDFNGILDTWEEFDVINKDNLNRLKKIVDVTAAKVVISSSCKRNYVETGVMGSIMAMLVNTLLENGIDVIGVTPNSDTRENEILSYISNHSEIEEFVILDDDYDMFKLCNHLVKLPCQSIGKEQNGLQDEHVKEAILILSKRNNCQ